MKGSAAFLRTLKSENIKYIFGNPGTTEISLLNTLTEFPEMKYILTLHESVAVGMADGYARASHSPGVASVHTTVGTANALGMTINAFADYSPLIVTAALKDSRSLGGGVFCDAPFHTGDLMRQYTKWSWQCLESDNISRDTSMALHHALASPQGPVFLGIPEKFLGEGCKRGTAAFLECFKFSTDCFFRSANKRCKANTGSQKTGFTCRERGRQGRSDGTFGQPGREIKYTCLF